MTRRLQSVVAVHVYGIIKLTTTICHSTSLQLVAILQIKLGGNLQCKVAYKMQNACTSPPDIQRPSRWNFIIIISRNDGGIRKLILLNRRLFVFNIIW